MPMMKTLQNLRLETTEGSVLQFKADEPKYVPPRAVAAATARGCVMVDEKDRTYHEDMQKLSVDFSGQLRQSLLFLALDSVMKKNDPKQFDGSGVPTAESLGALVGFSVASSEVAPIYQLWHQVQDGADFEIHKDAEQVQRILEAEHKPELQELALEAGLDETFVKKSNMKDLRKAALIHLSGYAPE